MDFSIGFAKKPPKKSTERNGFPMKHEKHEPLLLASASPRRAELLTTAGIPFECVPSHADELPSGSCSPEALVVENARRKAEEVSSRFPGRVVLGADTLVVLDGQALGKPKDRTDAKRMLRALSGRVHQVMTGVCLTDGDKTETALSVTSVTFRALDDALIERYVASGECDDKAGAYGIQEKGCVLVERLEGDYFGVVGLPICTVDKLLERFLPRS